MKLYSSTIPKTKVVSILGSTGSIGTQSLEIIDNLKMKVFGLSANSSSEKILQQAKACKPEVIAMTDSAAGDEVEDKFEGQVLKGERATQVLAAMSGYDTLINSVVGSAGVRPTYAAQKSGKKVCLANKETLVTAGEIIMKQAKKQNMPIIPIDSEHSALLQCIVGEDPEVIKKLIITCSGGPFRSHTLEQLQSVTKAQALDHPNWDMGAKITIDSSTLMNKGFEVIEAHHLYDMPVDKIQVVVHPQSIIHSMVEYSDHSIKAQLDHPDMRIPIQYSLTFPKRSPAMVKPYDFFTSKELTFEKPDLVRFPCLKHAFDSIKAGGSMPAVLNAANEVAVARFLKEDIKYTQIAQLIKDMMNSHAVQKDSSIDEIMDIDKDIKKKAEEWCG